MTTKQLVELNKKEIVAESHLVARKIGVKHAEFMKKINIVISKIDKFRVANHNPKYRFETRNYRGQDFKICLMSREFFSLVMMRFETKKAFEWQIKFNNAFYEMERQLLAQQLNMTDPQWLEQRKQSKALRHDTTDVIQDFVEYATAQGSTGAKWYYASITNTTYKALGFIKNRQPKLRDALDSLQLSWLMTTESFVKSALVKYMNEGLFYKDIYKKVAKDLVIWAEPLIMIEYKETNQK